MRNAFPTLRACKRPALISRYRAERESEVLSPTVASVCNCGSVEVSTVSSFPETIRSDFSLLCRCRIPFMKSPKESSLAVSYFLPEIPFLKREAKLYADESGYLFVQYSGEAEIQEKFNSDALSELLKLIPVMEYIYDEKGKKRHGIYNIPDIDPNKVLAYINRFGVVGISDLDFRSSVLSVRDLSSITRITGLNQKNAQKLYKGKTLDPKFLDRLTAIHKGDEVPYRLVKKILEDLAKSARLYINLLEDDAFGKNEVLLLTDKNRKRIVSAWNGFGGAFLDSEDPASSKFNLNEEWTYSYGGKKKLSPFDFAEGALSSFSQIMNKHLSLVTKSVVTTKGVRDFILENTGLETAFSAYLMNAFRNHKVKKICVECGSVYLPERVKKDNQYCGESCSKKVRNRRLRAKKKVSASKAGSKTTSKARKEKK